MSCGESVLVDTVDTSNSTIQVELPAGVKLDTSRVGEQVTYAYETNVGETVRFEYSGGSEYGVRNVLVVKRDEDSLEGLTLERDGGYRRYTDGNISGNITIVEPFVVNPNSGSISTKRIRFDKAGTALLASLTGEQLAELYGRYVAVEGDGTSFDADTGEVVVELPEAENRFTTISEDGTGPAVVISNKAGKSLRLWLYPSISQIGFDVDGEGGVQNLNATPEQLRDQLVEFLA